jgi:hypothetical protein
MPALKVVIDNDGCYQITQGHVAVAREHQLHRILLVEARIGDRGRVWWLLGRQSDFGADATVAAQY